MLIVVKIWLLLCLVGIIYQDFKERIVYLWLLLITTCLFGFLFYRQSLFAYFLINVSLNIGVLLVIVLILFLYAKFKLQKALNDTFGIGDAIFFLAIALGFPSATFIVLFSFSLFFSLVVYLLLRNKLKHKTVPLAGLQALFFSLLFLLNWSFNLINLYQF